MTHDPLAAMRWWQWLITATGVGAWFALCVFLYANNGSGMC